MRGEWTLPTAYEILDTAIERYLPGPSTTWVEFTREQISSGGAIYHLHQRLLGDLGKITIRKVSATETTMLIERPEYPRRNPTPEEMASIKAIEDKEEYYRALVALNREIEAECHALYLRRVEHQEKVIEAMFCRMVRDPRGPRIEVPKRQKVHLPKRLKDYLRWKEIWNLAGFRVQLRKGASYQQLEDWLKSYPNLALSKYTIRKIVLAGEAGKLKGPTLQ